MENIFIKNFVKMIKKMKILLFLNGINSDWFVKKSYIDNEGIEGEILTLYWRIQHQSESPGHKFTQIRLIHLHMVR